MLYYFTKQDELSPLPTVQGLEIQEVDDPRLMSVLGQISLEEARKRFANEHKAYVAYLHQVPAAFGWMAMGKARIGELNHEFILPLSHRYLWNFRTLPDFRGLGIYPQLLQYIIASEKAHSDCFWIMHAPENNASQRGIRKAGFKLVGKVSVVEGSEVIFTEEGDEVALHDALDTFSFIKSEKQAASCWNCSSPYLVNRKKECCCKSDNRECTHHLYQVIHTV
ncbi:GNAT family N-acetyltransferase [Cesiribacter sp. SM1]|uniref:GNAT family N-acetyltransferase n=1 Tax=Cesiribacter sp. SM1 TaxID=2861196 RepID=UPI001CD52683|nr:GNAT family N-acetyltransferase [Cesiribacter sp. SM1]